jgi:rhomboid family GlyGly-CTERM serine protease
MLKRCPWVTVGLAAASLLASFATGAPEALEYRRSQVSSGEIWRLLTGQMVHWSPRMTCVDLGMVLLLGAWLEWRSRRLAVITLAVAAVLVGLGVHGLTRLSEYRGSSGLGSALFVAVAVEIWRTAPRARLRYLSLGALLLFFAKAAWEMLTARCLFAGPFPPGVEVAPTAHLLGGLAGWMSHVGFPIGGSQGSRAADGGA